MMNKKGSERQRIARIAFMEFEGTLKDAERLSGYDYTTISRWVNFKADLTYKACRDFCSALGASYEDLLLDLAIRLKHGSTK